ncbi:MAG: NosD domain-containing protein [Candidatus Thorarchaeota archaeon]
MSFPKTFLVLCLVAGGFLFITSVSGVGESTSYQVRPFLKSSKIQAFRTRLASGFLDHNPIAIDSNENFATTVTAKGWSGNGSVSNPFIIDGLNIESFPPQGISISISNTDKYFEIINCFLTGPHGIVFSHVKNGAIINNVLKNTLGGNNERMGIILADNSSYNTIANNTLFNIEFPIAVDGNNNLIEYNQLHDNINGISIRGNNNLIANNTIQDAEGGPGIQIGDALNNTISQNMLLQNFYGIDLVNTNNCKIIQNSIVSSKIGVVLGLKSTNNLVTTNIFQNNLDLTSQAVDNGINNMFHQNYWSEWTVPDDNGNGIVDNVYLIEGRAGNTDPFPLASVDQIDGLHFLTFPSLIRPKKGELLAEYSLLQWNSPNDSMGHSISYSLYFSSDNGNSWVQLIINHTSTYYTWDTSSLTDESQVLIKIVALCSDGWITAYFSETFILESGNLSSNLQMITLLVVLIAIVGIGSFLVYNAKIKSPQGFNEILQSAPINVLKNLYHKVVIGVDNIASGIIPELQSFPVLEPPTESVSLIEYFPSEIRHDLLSKLKGRSVLTLIEIAYHYPDNVHTLELSKILDISPTTLSYEIKRLHSLNYLKFEPFAQGVHDARFRFYSLTPKGAHLLYLLKGVLNTAIMRMREFESGGMR